jgi:hypothetical protein
MALPRTTPSGPSYWDRADTSRSWTPSLLTSTASLRPDRARDTQVIIGGFSDDPMGPYKIVNNFLEAVGRDHILFGGGDATMPPRLTSRSAAITIFKPLIWMKGQDLDTWVEQTGSRLSSRISSN